MRQNQTISGQVTLKSPEEGRTALLSSHGNYGGNLRRIDDFFVSVVKLPR